MRILYVVTAATFGGAVQHIIHLMKFMAERGHIVGLSAAPERRLLREAHAIGAMVFPNPHFVFSPSLYHDPLAFTPVLRAIRVFQPDLVSSHSTKAGLVARFCAAVMRRPVLFTAHGWGFAESRSWWTSSILRNLERLAAKVSAKIICVSEFDRKLALQLGIGSPEQLVVIHNGMPPEPYQMTNRGKSSFKLKQDTNPKPILMTVGRLAPPKDFETLLKALQKLDHGKMIIIGDGPDRTSVEKFINQTGLSQKFYLLGEREDVPDLLSTAEIFVLSSKKEGLPRTIIEAMLSELPVVATRVGGVPELVEHGVTGFLVPPADPEALALALQKLINDRDLCRSMGSAGREKALRQFTLERMLRETLKVYEKFF